MRQTSQLTIGMLAPCTTCGPPTLFLGSSDTFFVLSSVEGLLYLFGGRSLGHCQLKFYLIFLVDGHQGIVKCVLGNPISIVDPLQLKYIPAGPGSHDNPVLSG